MKTLVFILGMILFSTAQANNRYENYQGQGTWSFNSAKQSVQVFVKGAYVYAQTQKELPASRLKRFNSNLLNGFTEQFIVIQDVNNDGWQDVAVLKSVGFAGNGDSRNARCYAVFEYVPGVYSFKTRPGKTVCM